MTMMRFLLAILTLLAGLPAIASEEEAPRAIVYPIYPPAPREENAADAAKNSAGCLSCHTATDMPTMHANSAIVLGCADCHGGDPATTLPTGTQPASALY